MPTKLFNGGILCSGLFLHEVGIVLMKRALCSLGILLFNFSVLAQNPEERISLQQTLNSFSDHHLLLASKTAEDSEGQAAKKIRSKKGIPNADAPQNGTPHIYKATDNIDYHFASFKISSRRRITKDPLLFFLAVDGLEEVRLNLKAM